MVGRANDRTCRSLLHQITAASFSACCLVCFFGMTTCFPTVMYYGILCNLVRLDLLFLASFDFHAAIVNIVRDTRVYGTLSQVMSFLCFPLSSMFLV